MPRNCSRNSGFFEDGNVMRNSEKFGINSGDRRRVRNKWSWASDGTYKAHTSDRACVALALEPSLGPCVASAKDLGPDLAKIDSASACRREIEASRVGFRHSPSPAFN